MSVHRVVSDRLDNLVSVFMTIGSPTLAGYSLAITSLNTRWLERQFFYLHFSNKEHILPVVGALQHIPFTINPLDSLLPSLIVLPQNDQYWKHLGAAAQRTKQASIALWISLIWVFLAFLLTLIDSFVDFNHFITIPGAAGYSTVAVWSYLLCLVTGWLEVGFQREGNSLCDALDGAHQIAYMATAAEPALAAQVAGPSARGIDPSTGHIDYANRDEKKGYSYLQLLPGIHLVPTCRTHFKALQTCGLQGQSEEYCSAWKRVGGQR